MKKLSLKQFYEISLERFAELVRQGKVNKTKIKRMAQMYGRAAELKNCDILLNKDRTIYFKEI